MALSNVSEIPIISNAQSHGVTRWLRAVLYKPGHVPRRCEWLFEGETMRASEVRSILAKLDKSSTSTEN
jgi:hypothetical protein